VGDIFSLFAVSELSLEKNDDGDVFYLSFSVKLLVSSAQFLSSRLCVNSCWMPSSTSICQANLFLVLKIQLYVKSLAAKDLW